ncbi:Common plant regulatory factor 1 like isoform 1 [Actinidia chinensis var. chinensis]|uniref:Common plant regulatory factor 1 like isoform 1 n=1 Tax=Actinidia chinensis var. chinensis TaxID=1590841 RepID=A0A2R6QIZ7_ACTCC|nr:Common plant regulatory factor 1 like isoform 1 [Actinidia chinensis var. chinensis]
MGSSEDMKSPKSAKVSPSNQEHTNIHLYPDWANIQAYYGPGVPVPPSYLNPAVMAGHVPHPHLWSPPQTLMPSYGVPYSTIYSPGVVYAHPAVPLVAAPVSTQQLSNSSDITDQGLRKKLKSVDGVAMRDVKNNVDVDGEGLVHEASQSAECGIRASSNASDCNYGDQRQHKQERRKQANRESAKRSRLRKQAETEELMERYETLKVENIALKSEMNQLMEGSEKLRVESAALMEKLNVADVTHKEEMVLDEIEPDLAQPNCSEE